MGYTENLGLLLTPTDDHTTTFKAWRIALNGEVNSNMQILDEAYGGLTDDLSKAVQSSSLYIQHSNLGGYTSADDFPANRIIELASNVTESDIANLPAYGELAYIMTVTYNASSNYSAQIYFGRYTMATRIKAVGGWQAWSQKANFDDVLKLDASVEGDHAIYSDKISNVDGVRCFVVSSGNWDDMPAEIKSSATIINMHQSSSYDIQLCLGRGEDKYFGWRIIRRSDRVVHTDWKSPTADLLINGNLLYGKGTSLNIGGGTGTCEVIKITDCPNMNIVSGVKVTRDSGTTGFLGTRTATKFHCVAGTTYEFSVWARGTGTVRLLVDNLYLRDFECDANGKWQKFTLRFTSNADADYHFYIYNITASKYIDIAGRELFVYTPSPEVSGLRRTKYWTPNWFQGSIGTSGKQIASATRIRSEGFANFADSIDNEVTINIPEGYGLVGRRYSEPNQNAFERTINVDGTWITGVFTLMVSPNKYYRFVLRKEEPNQDANITPDEGSECGISFEYATLENRPEIKILGIGNSHTKNAFQYLRQILDDAGYDAQVGHYYWGGSTLREQYEALENALTPEGEDLPFPDADPFPENAYYRKYDVTGSHAYSNSTLITALTDEPWDAIVFQNQTDASGQIEAFFSADFNINDFIAEVKNLVDNEELRIGIMAPHSRASDASHTTTLHQNQLDAAIQNTIPIVAANMTQCDFIVNAGLAIKYARQNKYLNAIDDEMTYDDHHLSAGVPRYIEAMVYAMAICGVDVGDKARFASESGIDKQLAYLGIQCAREAVLNRDLPPKFDGISAQTVLSVGDSICYGSRNNRKGFLGDLCIMREDASMYGAYLSNYMLGTANNLCIYQQLIDFAASNSNKEYSPDVIVANGGINDYFGNVALGTVPTHPAQDDTDAEALNKSTLIGGLEYLFYQMTKLYPEAQRFFVITHKTNNLPWTQNTAGYTQTQMAEAIAATCRVYGVEIIDIFNQSMVNTAFEQYSSPVAYNSDPSVTYHHYVDKDGIHPLDKGYKEGYLPFVREALRKGTHKIPAVSASGNVAYLKGGVYGAPLKSVITQIEHEGLTDAHIYVTKKNMLPRPYIHDDIFVNRGITFTVQDDGTVTASGTITSSAESDAQPYNALKRTWLQPGVVYSISHGCSHPRAFCVGYFRNYTNTGTITPDGWDVDNDRAISVTYISTLNNGGFHAKRTFYVNEPCILEFQLRFNPDTVAQTITDVVFKPMLYVGGEGVNWDTAPTWEKAEGQRIAVSFEDNAVGRGILNVTTGELTVTHAFIEFDGTETWGIAWADTNPAFYSFVSPQSGVTSGGEFSLFDYVNIWSGGGNNGAEIEKNATATRIYVRYDGMPQTVEAWKQQLAAWKTAGTPLQAVYPMETPQTIQLTPTEVATLNGFNQIISDTGAISVERRA